MKLKITVDRNSCIGAASCVAIAPEVFELDDDNKSVVINSNNSDKETILQAAKACPSEAITVVDEQTNSQLYPKKY